MKTGSHLWGILLILRAHTHTHKFTFISNTNFIILKTLRENDQKENWYFALKLAVNI